MFAFIEIFGVYASSCSQVFLSFQTHEPLQLATRGVLEPAHSGSLKFCSYSFNLGLRCIAFHSSFATESEVIWAPATTTFKLWVMGTTFGFFFRTCRRTNEGARHQQRHDMMQLRLAHAGSSRTFFQSSANVLQAIAMPPIIAMMEVMTSCKRLTSITDDAGMQRCQ